MSLSIHPFSANYLGLILFYNYSWSEHGYTVLLGGRKIFCIHTATQERRYEIITQISTLHSVTSFFSMPKFLLPTTIHTSANGKHSRIDVSYVKVFDVPQNLVFSIKV